MKFRVRPLFFQHMPRMLLPTLARLLSSSVYAVRYHIADKLLLPLIQPGYGRKRRAATHPLFLAGKAFALCRGTGIEIGALHRRLPLLANVFYLDLRATSALLDRYNKDRNVDHIGQVQLITTGSRYPFLDSDALDFVASSHVIEHTVNPSRQIEEWLRIVRPGGIIYIIAPDKRYCFDRRREATSLEHFIDEYQSDTDSVSMDHYRDFIINTHGEDGINHNTSDAYIAAQHATQANIHVHTFTEKSFREFLDHFAPVLGYDVIHYSAYLLNIHAALRKRSPVN